MATIGSRGRSYFVERFVELLDLPDTPAAVRTIWNESIAHVISD